MDTLTWESFGEEPASVAIGQHLLKPFLGEFMELYPEIELEVQLENRRVDLFIGSGTLCQILRGWRTPTFRFYALYPSHRGVTLKLRVWLDFFGGKLAE